MVSYTNLFLIKGMSCWNAITTWTGRIKRLWYSLRGWMDPESGSWLLYSHSLFPVCCRDAYGFNGAEWKYIPSTTTLQWIGKQEEEKGKEKEGEKIIYRIGWLSAQTTTSQDTKDMDAFLTELSIETNGSPPPLMILLQAWSLYDRRWWSADPNIRIEWIDTLAEEYSAKPVFVKPVFVKPMSVKPMSANPVEEITLPLVQRGNKKKN